MSRFLLILAALLFTACAPNALLRDPRTGQLVDCTAMSEVNTPAASYPNYGSAGRAMGAGMADGVASAFRERACINTYLAAGFQCVQGICAK